MGQNCQLGLRDNSGAGQWWEVSPGDFKAAPRTASAGVYLASAGAMYMFGGKRGRSYSAFPITDWSLIMIWDMGCIYLKKYFCTFGFLQRTPCLQYKGSHVSSSIKTFILYMRNILICIEAHYDILNNYFQLYFILSVYQNNIYIFFLNRHKNVIYKLYTDSFPQF